MLGHQRHVFMTEQEKEAVRQLNEVIDGVQALNTKLNRLNGAVMRAVYDRGSITKQQYIDLYVSIYDSPPPN